MRVRMTAKCRVVGAAFVLLCLAAVPPVPAPVAPAIPAPVLPDFVAPAKAVRPAVVTIFAEKRLAGSGGRDERIRELGSGIIVRVDGIVLTNGHVVSDAVSLRVRLSDGREISATVLGEDKDTDLAAVRLDGPGPFPVARLGESSRLEVGQWVLAIGSSLGFDQTVSHGIISGIGRTGVGLAREEYLVQTDASVHRGNSGGPLVDLEGRVIAVNAAVAAGPGASPRGMGFAIPIDLARRILDDLLSRGEVSRSWIGVLKVSPLDDDLAKRRGLSSAGALRESMGLSADGGALEIGEIMPGSPAARAGLRSGDLLLRFGDRALTKSADLRIAISESRIGEEVAIEILREGKKTRASIVIGIRPRVPPAEEGPSFEGLGLSVAALTTELAHHLGYSGENGVLVRKVIGPPAIRADFQKGDLVLSVGQRRIASPEDFVRAAREVERLRAISVEFRRGSERKRVLLAP